MTDKEVVPPQTEPTTEPKITVVTKTKNPNRVAQGKKLAAIRAEKRRLREQEVQKVPYDDDYHGYQRATFYIMLVSSVAALISIPFVYRYLTGPRTPESSSGGTGQTEQPKESEIPRAASDMIEFD